MKKPVKLSSDKLKKGVVIPNGFDGSFCLDTLLPTMQQAYIRGFEVKYGANRDKWSTMGRMEFGSLGNFQLPKHLTLLDTIEMEQNLYFWERDQQATLPMGFLLDAIDYQLLIFRGTLSAFEWYHDVLIRQIETKEYTGKIHQGFYTIAQSVLQDEWMRKINPDKSLFIAGHSLGGALATISAARFSKLNPTVYLFGSPRVGNKVFADYINQQVPTIFRVENAFDMVTELPPEEIPIVNDVYRHVGKLVSVHAGTEQIKKYTDLRNREVLLGHFPSVYIQALKLL